MEGVHRVKMAHGNLVTTTKNKCLLRLALHTEWGPAVLEPFCFSVMQGEDDTILWGKLP